MGNTHTANTFGICSIHEHFNLGVWPVLVTCSSFFVSLKLLLSIARMNVVVMWFSKLCVCVVCGDGIFITDAQRDMHAMPSPQSNEKISQQGWPWRKADNEILALFHSRERDERKEGRGYHDSYCRELPLACTACNFVWATRGRLRFICGHPVEFEFCKPAILSSQY